MSMPNIAPAPRQLSDLDLIATVARLVARESEAQAMTRRRQGPGADLTMEDVQAGSTIGRLRQRALARYQNCSRRP